MSLSAEHRPSTEPASVPAPSGHSDAGPSRAAGARSPQAQAAIRARARSELGDLDYVRTLQRWIATGARQTDIAKDLGLTQAAISRALKRHRDTPMPVPGFAGATPMEVCKRYAAGDLSRAEVVDQLTRFPYTPTPAPSGWDDLVVDPPGAWSELETAQGLRLIDATIYRDVFLARHPEYAEEYAAEIAAEAAVTVDLEGDVEGDVEASGDARLLEQAGVISIGKQSAEQGEAQGGSRGCAGDGLSGAPRT